jgi:hypothetical protein
MDFNDIQSAWNKDNKENIVLPTNLEKLKSANMPIDKVRKNLRFELVIQTIAMLCFGLIPMLTRFPANMVVPYYLIYAIMVAISIYYLGKLFLFYKRLNKIALNTKDSLYETYFDIRLNMELYKTFTFALLPFFIIYLIGYIYYKIPKFADLLSSQLQQNKLLVLLLILIFTIILIGFVTEIWVQSVYGKYAKQIRKVLDELKE